MRREIVLARKLRTPGVLLHLPPKMEYDSFAHPSLAAAIMLGLRQVIGGSPSISRLSPPSATPVRARRRALLIHDTVPGGTGYLAEFSDHAKVWAVLTRRTTGGPGMSVPRRGPARVPPLSASVRTATRDGQGVARHRVEILERHRRRRARHPDLDDWTAGSAKGASANTDQ